jgi:legumain
MAARLRPALLLSACLCAAVAWARPNLEPGIRLPSERASAAESADDDSVGTRWAVLIAGSNGYYNYRHQVPPCSDHRVDCFRARNFTSLAS